MLATIFEGVLLYNVGMTIHTRFIEYGDRPLEEAALLAKNQLMKPNIVYEWISYTTVRVWNVREIRGPLIDIIYPAYHQ